MSEDPWGHRELRDERRNALDMAIRLLGDRKFEYPEPHQSQLRLKDYEEIAIGTAGRLLAWILTGRY